MRRSGRRAPRRRPACAPPAATEPTIARRARTRKHTLVAYARTNTRTCAHTPHAHAHAHERARAHATRARAHAHASRRHGGRGRSVPALPAVRRRLCPSQGRLVRVKADSIRVKALTLSESRPVAPVRVTSSAPAGRAVAAALRASRLRRARAGAARTDPTLNSAGAGRTGRCCR